MVDVSTRNFGYLIAYVIPGFVVVSAASRYSEAIGSWLGVGQSASATVGGFLYATVASVATGMIVSALRWLVLDFIHHRTGVKKPHWDFSLLQSKRAAFVSLVENHYRYYQFYGNTLVALAITSALPGALSGLTAMTGIVGVVMAVGLSALLFVASRDALRKYYARTGELLGERRRRRVGDR